MSKVATVVYFAALWLTSTALLAEEPDPPAADQGQGPSDEERKRRVDFMKADVGHYAVVAADKRDVPLVLTAEPVLRYSNPVRTSFTDGTVYLWLEGQRPLAAAVLSIRDKGNVVRELTSITARPLKCRRDGQVAWMPRGGNLVDQAFAEVPAPAASDKRRLREMRDLARRFRVIKKSSPDVDLRLMPQPVHRFAAPTDGVLDGAVFAFVEATDPDFLLLIEAHRSGPASAAEWRYTLARMCSGPLEVELDGRPIWSATGYWDNPRSLKDPYAEIPFGVYPLR